MRLSVSLAALLASTSLASAADFGGSLKDDYSAWSWGLRQ